MKVNFDILGKAFSVNKMSSRDQRFKTSEYKDWYSKTKQLIEDCPEYKELLDMAEDAKKANAYELHIYITCYYPRWFFRNKSGQISAKTFDCSNIEKPLLDLIIQDLMGLNDRNVTLLVSSKEEYGGAFMINVQLELDCNTST